jgi:hypothetical protein
MHGGGEVAGGSRSSTAVAKVTADGQLHSEKISEKEHLLVGAALGAVALRGKNCWKRAATRGKGEFEWVGLGGRVN